jgi:hypothetical protein
MIPEVTLPAWQSSTAGARIRAALWLAQEIGEGGTFRKAQLRAAFPSVEQIDRRVRELREDGWVFATNREDLALASDELRLVRIGGAVWDKSYRRARTSSISANDRKATFAADGFACRHCGVAAGEPFADDPIRIARLSVARSPSPESRGLVTLCDRCIAAGPGAGTADLDAVVRDGRQLDPADREQLLRWMARDERDRTALDRVWARWRTLSHDLRDQAKRQLEQ